MNQEKYSLKQSFHSFTELYSYIGKKKKNIYAGFLLYFPAYILAGFLQIYLPKAVLTELENKQTIPHFIMTLTVISLLLFIALFFRDKSKVRLQNDSILIAQEMNMEYARKFLYVEYPFLEEPAFLSHRDNAKKALYGRGMDSDAPCLDDFLPILNDMIASLGTALVYAIMISRLSLILTNVILITSLAAMWTSIRTAKVSYDKLNTMANASRKFHYITDEIGNFSLSKDIRLYHMNSWLLNTGSQFKKIWLHCKAVALKHSASVQLEAAFFMGIQNLFVYLFLLTGIFKSQIRLSDLILYAGASAALSSAFTLWSKHVYQLRQLSIDYGNFSCFLNYGKDETRTALPVKKEKAVITLEHVSFRFPGMERDLLHDLNFTADYGEKLAVVGVNGAGKTTLMKLVCGLLLPTEGRILINGEDIAKMSPQERYAWFSCAFQDISFLPFTIAENISMRTLEDTDEERVWSCLTMAGIKEKIEKTKDNIFAYMEKDINENAVEFSGGERQKLILARALYRMAPVLILDEPTAALDPLAENDIYLKYAAFSEDKTSFFVSHRLSSTKFCDKILLLDGGSIIEQGTHDELLQKDGLYARMFTLQSHYYQEREA